uniref:Uncharacterized protein n=1 Tax=Rhizophora mucronata TaxID=61149 RepID=A0A2P2N8M0_RHIMU
MSSINPYSISQSVFSGDTIFAEKLRDDFPAVARGFKLCLDGLKSHFLGKTQQSEIEQKNFSLWSVRYCLVS